MRSQAIPTLIALLVSGACASSPRTADRETSPPREIADGNVTEPTAEGEDEALAVAAEDDDSAPRDDVQPDEAGAETPQAELASAEDQLEDDDAEPDQPKSPLEILAGNYRYSGGKDSIARSIEDVVDEMSVFARNIARNRLTEANDAPQRIAIAASGDRVTITMDGEKFTGVIGGKPIAVKNSEGSTSRMRFRMVGKSLVQVFDAKSGDRINVFTPRRNGKGLTLQVTIKSPKLPKDVKYRLAYK